MAISQLIPARAQYAASAAPVFPLDVAMHSVLPHATMSEMAAQAKRSLYEPLGFVNSNLKKRFFRPTDGPMRRDRTMGVFPSPSVMRAVIGTGSSHFENRQIPEFMDEFLQD